MKNHSGSIRKVPTDERATKLAEALAKDGIVSCVPEPSPNPHHAACQAYQIWFNQTASEWRQYRQLVKDGLVPESELYRKYAVACRASLRRRQLPEELIEPVTYAWGFFEALYEASQRAQSEG
ncbi:MAG: hypothetical protein ABJN35_00035 [Erythrobacter sp.]